MALVPPECLTAFVSASWMTRYADTSSVRDSGRGSPSIDELDRQPALSGLGDELGQLGEIRLRRQLIGLVGAAEHAEQPVQLEDCLPARVLDRAEDLLGPGRLLCHDAARRPGLHAHDADVVGDDVVQLARDPDSLLEHGTAGVLLPLALELPRPAQQARARDPDPAGPRRRA